MSNKFKGIYIKSRTYYFFNDINKKHFDTNGIKTDENSFRNKLICYIGYVTMKYSEYVKTSSVIPLYLILQKVNGYFDKIDKNKYLTLVPTNESKTKTYEYEELRSKIRDLIRSITKPSDDYDEKYMKIKFDSDEELPVNKAIEIPSMTIVM